MDDLIQLLTTAKELAQLLKDKKLALDKQEAAVALQAQELKASQIALAEQAATIKEKQSAEATLAEAKALRNEANALMLQVSQAQAALDNTNQEQLQRIQVAKADAQLVADLAEQVRTDKAALQEERATYKAKVLKELQDNLKMGKV